MTDDINGTFNMTAQEAELCYTKEQKVQVAVLLQFDDGPHAGQTLNTYLHFTEKTKAATIRSLRLLGWKGDDLSDLSTVRGSAPCTVGMEADLQGVMRPRVKWIGGGALMVKNQMSVEQKKAFAASMLATVAGSNSAPAPTAGPGVAKVPVKDMF